MISRRDLERVIEDVMENADTEGMHYSTMLMLTEELTEEIYAFLEESEQNG
jgi:hypothetical protein